MLTLLINQNQRSPTTYQNLFFVWACLQTCPRSYHKQLYRCLCLYCMSSSCVYILAIVFTQEYVATHHPDLTTGQSLTPPPNMEPKQPTPAIQAMCCLGQKKQHVLQLALGLNHHLSARVSHSTYCCYTQYMYNYNKLFLLELFVHLMKF